MEMVAKRFFSASWLLFFCFLLSGLSLSLTLERPSVSVDWGRAPQRQSATAEASNPPNRLFGTVEIRGPIKGVPQWERIVRLCKNKTGITEDFGQAGAGRKAEAQAWEKIKADMANAAPMQKLQAVNKFINKWPYRTDMEIYGVLDYWGTPAEFIKNSGDCDCFAIAKFFALIELGFSRESLRVVALKDRIRNIDHAILVAYVDNEAFILDNVSPLVLSHNKYGHYQPIFSVNLEHKWMHVMPSK